MTTLMLTGLIKTETASNAKGCLRWNKYCDIRAVYELLVDNPQGGTLNEISDLITQKNQQAETQQTPDFFEAFGGRNESDRNEILAICLDELIVAKKITVSSCSVGILYKKI